MKFLTSGCSFTGTQGPKGDSGWPAWLKMYGEIRNVAMPGAGNRYIADSIIHQLSHNEDYDCVLVMWSGLQRIDFTVDKFFGEQICPLNEIIYYPCGDIIQNKFVNLIKFGNEKSRAYHSLMEMIKLQSFLKYKKIPYYFMSYVDYWNNKDYIINRNFGIYKYEILTTLAKQLDFTNFIFYDDTKCLYEVAEMLSSFAGDNFHPGIEAFAFWMDKVVIPRLKKDKIC